MGGSWRHEQAGSRHERWCVHCACLVDVVPFAVWTLLCGLCCVDFAVWCRKNARITVALCVRADTQL